MKSSSVFFSASALILMSQWLALQFLDHFAFVRNHGPAGWTPGRPDVQYDDLPFVILQLDLFVVQIDTLDVRRLLANRQMMDLEQGSLGLIAYFASIQLHVGEVLGRTLVVFLGFSFRGLVAILGLLESLLG